MTDEERNELDAYKRSTVCVETVLTDLPNPSLGWTAYLDLKAAVADIEALSSEQTSKDGDKRGGTMQKRLARKQTNELWREIAATARTIARAKEGFYEGFRIPHHAADEDYFAAARAASAKARANERDFTDLGMPGGFVGEFNDAINSFGAALGLTSGSLEGRGAAVAGIDAAFDRAEDAFEILDRFVRNFYRRQPDKLAAWRIASHVERESSKKREGGQTPTN